MERRSWMQNTNPFRVVAMQSERIWWSLLTYEWRNCETSTSWSKRLDLIESSYSTYGEWNMAALSFDMNKCRVNLFLEQMTGQGAWAVDEVLECIFALHFRSWSSDQSGTLRKNRQESLYHRWDYSSLTSNISQFAMHSTGLGNETKATLRNHLQERFTAEFLLILPNSPPRPHILSINSRAVLLYNDMKKKGYSHKIKLKHFPFWIDDFSSAIELHTNQYRNYEEQSALHSTVVFESLLINAS